MAIVESTYSRSRMGFRLLELAMYGILFFIAVLLPYVATHFSIEIGLLLIMVIIGVPFTFYMVTNLKFGIVVLLVFSFFLSELGRFVIKDFPLGVVIDVFLLLMLISLVVKKIRAGSFRWASNPVSYAVWFWIIINVVSLLNPKQSSQAWFYAVRGTALYLTFFFILLDVLDFSFLKKLLLIWIALAFLGSLYGLFQEFHGLFDFERDWITSDIDRFKLYFNWGRFRIFSFFNDPALFGILMVATSVFCFTLASIADISMPKRVILFTISGITLLAAIYSGTRTAYVMFPVGVLFHTIVVFRVRILVFSAIVTLIGAYIIFSDIQNVGPLIGRNALFRIRSAFKPSDDPSFQVRERNQERIKPFIQNNPIGAGIGSLSVWGSRFNPHSEMADFAPDSGFVRAAVELGWLGLIVYELWLGTVLIVGIRNYFKLKTKNMRVYMASILAVLYAFVVANYPQQAIIIFPSNFIFFMLMAAVVKMPTFETPKTT